MKTVVHKSTIPETQLFVIKDLRERHFDSTWHAHSEFQLFVVLEGTGTRFIGDNIKTFKPGELILTGPNLPHLWRSDDDYFLKNGELFTHGIVLYLNEQFLGENTLEKEEMIALKKLFSKSMRGLEFYGERKDRVIALMQELIKLKGLDRVIVLLQILQELASTREFHFISHASYDNPFKKGETDRANIVYEFVIKNFRKKIILEDVAAMVHMTPTSFSRYFTRHSNKNFSAFVSEIRIKHACKLLVETEQAIEEICYECGFNTLSNFNKQFKDLIQDKPSSYRKQFMTV
ncbi:AraC family transcriptional regulator [Flavihumibacter profundi]|uniref:AraC family transcriptional regulator n=1 Tax=Flavihumibacter profundi TaxID=2716883 RepID=UPI001CC3E862|nr:AraC family transcriptional regulator [Flavihumibacter profundi]MBZ5856909.1 AraC family transcriptional regulator [Flavihumibacter profundi]